MSNIVDHRKSGMKATRFGQEYLIFEINMICPEKGYDFLLEDEEGHQIREWGKNLEVNEQNLNEEIEKQCERIIIEYRNILCPQ